MEETYADTLYRKLKIMIQCSTATNLMLISILAAQFVLIAWEVQSFKLTNQDVLPPSEMKMSDGSMFIIILLSTLLLLALVDTVVCVAALFSKLSLKIIYLTFQKVWSCVIASLSVVCLVTCAINYTAAFIKGQENSQNDTNFYWCGLIAVNFIIHMMKLIIDLKSYLLAKDLYQLLNMSQSVSQHKISTILN